MGLNPDAKGARTRPLEHRYRWQDAVLYGLGIGAKADSELGFLYEGGEGPRVFPSYAVVPAFEALKELFDVVGGDFTGVVHGAQKITLRRPFAPHGVLTTVGTVDGVYDLKRMAQSVITTETRDEQGEVICETEWTLMFLKDGGFGGEAPPRSPKVRPPERDPDWVVSETTGKEQALLYRLSGDHNPLHADPAVAALAEKVTQGKPILHGLCTYGYIGRAIMQQECGNDPSRMKTFSGRFNKPIWPGETIVTSAWREEGRLVVTATTKERPEEPIFTNAYAETV